MHLKTIFLFSLILNASIILGQKQSFPKTILEIRKDKKFGYLNTEGKEIIPPIYDNAKQFSEGLLAVNQGAIAKDYTRKGGAWGYIDITGKIVIPFIYEDALDFSSGLAPVHLNGKYGFINQQNETIIDFQFEEATSFVNGLAIVKLNKKYGFINPKGEFVIQPTFDRVSHFHDGFSIIFKRTSSYEVVDDGYVYTEEIGTYGLIDKAGNIILEPIYDEIEHFHEGLAAIRKGGTQGFIDTTGKVTIPIQFDGVHNFSEGFAQVSRYSEETHSFWDGYINRKGQLVIDYKYQESSPFKNGFAKVSEKGTTMIRAIYIDENGKRVARDETEMGLGENFIDTDGEKQFAKNYQNIHTQGDCYIVRTHQGVGVLDKNLDEVLPTIYKHLQHLDEDLFVVKHYDSDKKVVVNDENETLFQIKCDKIQRISADKFLISQSTNFGKKPKKKKHQYIIIDKSGKPLTTLDYDFVAIRKIE